MGISPLDKLSNILITGLVAIPGGLLFSFLHVPMPWMLGPLTITSIYHALRGNRADWPVGFRNVALGVIGYSMGRTVNADTIEQVLLNLPWMAAITLLILMFSFAMGYLTHRKTGISMASSILGSMPGGLAQMIPLSEEIEEVDVSMVALMQVARVLAVLFIVPFVATYGLDPMPVPLPPQSIEPHHDVFIASLPTLLMAPVGAWIAIRVNIPIPFLLGPIFATTAMVLMGCPAPPVPYPVISLAQFIFGAYLGIRISFQSLRCAGKVFSYAIGGSAALVLFCYLISWGLTLVTQASLLTAFLSTAPGGIAEMGIVGLALGADLAFVMAYQLFRVFTILFLASPLLKWKFKRS